MREFPRGKTEKRKEKLCYLNEKIAACGLAATRGISKKPKLNYCMADSGGSVTILPGGNIGLCEHFSEDKIIGHIDKEGFDQAVVNSWKELNTPGGNRQRDRTSPTPFPLKSYTLSAGPTPSV